MHAPLDLSRSLWRREPVAGQRRPCPGVVAMVANGSRSVDPSSARAPRVEAYLARFRTTQNLQAKSRQIRNASHCSGRASPSASASLQRWWERAGRDGAAGAPGEKRVCARSRRPPPCSALSPALADDLHVRIRHRSGRQRGRIERAMACFPAHFLKLGAAQTWARAKAASSCAFPRILYASWLHQRCSALRIEQWRIGRPGRQSGAGVVFRGEYQMGLPRNENPRSSTAEMPIPTRACAGDNHASSTRRGI